MNPCRVAYSIPTHKKCTIHHTYQQHYLEHLLKSRINDTSPLYNTCPVNLPYFKSPTDLVGHYGPKQTSKHLFPFSIYSPALNCATCKTLLVQEGEIKDSNKTASTTHKCFLESLISGFAVLATEV